MVIATEKTRISTADPFKKFDSLKYGIEPIRCRVHTTYTIELISRKNYTNLKKGKPESSMKKENQLEKRISNLAFTYIILFLPISLPWPQCSHAT
jgi:hypothetical protein